MKMIHMVGTRFGRLSIIRFHKRDKHRNVYWLCTCDCGAERSVLGVALRKGHVVACHDCTIRLRPVVSPKRIERTYAAEYKTWLKIKEICYERWSWFYKKHGGRGIVLSTKWRHSFVCFLGEMGQKPTPKHRLERLDPDGNFIPSNCRWSLKGKW